MNEYFPDSWVLVDYSEQAGKPCYSVLAGWRGGYLDGDSWKRSSPIVSWAEYDEEIVCKVESGSVYCLRKSGVGYTGMTAGIVGQLEGKLNVVDEYNEIVKCLNKIGE